MRKNTIISISVAGLLVSTVAFTMRPGEDGLEPVKRADVVREVVSPGVVEPVDEPVALSFELSGRIAEVLVKEGDRVAEGQLLARLDDRLAKARVARAEAALEAARARRDAALRGSRADEIKAAEAEVAAAKATAWERAQQHHRAVKLASTSAVSAADLDGAKSAADAAGAALAAAEAHLALAKEGVRGEAKREAVAGVAAAEAELEAAKARLSDTELRAPRAGVILRRFAEPGEHVATMPPKVVFTLADVDHLQLRVEIDEVDVGRVGVGVAGWASADAYGARRFAGKIVSAQKELGRKSLRTDDPRGRVDTRVLEVMFAPDEPAELPLGLRMDVHLEAVARHGVLTVPLEAVRKAGDGLAIAVLEGGRETKREVTLGADDGVIAEVTSGLAEGELVRVR